MSPGHGFLCQSKVWLMMGQGVVPRLGKALFGGGSPKSQGLIPSPGSRPSWPLHSHACPGTGPCAGTHVQTAGWPSPGDSVAAVLLATALTASRQ